MTGSIDQRATVDWAVDGVTHVLHLATSKETPQTIIDVAVKGLFWLLEACRASPAFRQFILIGGDAGMGHFFCNQNPLHVCHCQIMNSTAHPARESGQGLLLIVPEGLLPNDARGARHVVIDPNQESRFADCGLGWSLEEVSTAEDRHHWAVLRTSTQPDTRPFGHFASF